MHNSPNTEWRVTPECKDAWARAAAAYMFGVTSLQTVYGTYDFTDEEIEGMFGPVDHEKVVDYIYELGGDLVLDVWGKSETGEDVYSINVSTYFTGEGGNLG